MSNLRNKIIRLANQKPELREHLLPLVTEKTAMGGKNVLADMVLDLMPEYFASSIKTSGGMIYISFKDTKDLKSISAELNLKTHDLQIHAQPQSQSAVETILKGRTEDLVLNLLQISKSEASKKIQMYLRNI